MDYQNRIEAYQKILSRRQELLCPIRDYLSQHDRQSVLEKSFLYVLAPTITEYVNWALQRALAQGRKRLYFLARDGYLMYHLAKRMVQERGLELDIRYLEVSRFSVRCAEYAFSGEKSLDSICVGGIDITFEKMMKRALLTKEEAHEIAEAAGFRDRYTEGLNYRQIQELKETLRKIPKLFCYIQRHAKPCYENICGYFRKQGLFDGENYVLVDSGWIGTLQMSIQHIISQELGREMQLYGYYFGLYEIPEKVKKGQYQSYYFGPKSIRRKVYFSNCLFEAIFSSPEGMTLGYAGEEKQYLPIRSTQKNPNRAAIEVWKTLLLDYANLYLRYEKTEQIDWKEEGRAVSPMLLRLFMGQPTKEEAKSFGKLQFCDDVLELQMQSVAAKWDEEEQRKQQFLSKILIRLNIKKEQLHDSAWPEGSNVLLGKNVRKGLRQERMYKRVMYLRKAMEKKEEKTSKKTGEQKILKQYLFVIHELTSREIKRKYARSSLGIIWSVLNPLLHMIIMSLIFSTMFRRSIENFPIYYLTGHIIWDLFSQATNSSMTSLVDNKSLLIKAKLPKQIFILSRIYTALVNLGYTCIPYLLMLLIFGIKVSWSMLLFPIVIACTLMFSMGIGYMLSVTYVFFADIKYLYSVLLTLLMYLSALFYPVSQLPEAMQTFIGCNPVYVSIAFTRECMMYGKVPEPMLWIKLIAWSVGSLVLGLVVFKAKENKVMQKV